MATALLTTPTRNAMAQALMDRVDAGESSGKLKFYTAPLPVSGDTNVSTQVLLGECVCDDPAAVVAGGAATFGAIARDIVANATGDAAFAEVVDSNGLRVGYLDVSDTTGNGVIKLGNIHVVEGGIIEVLGLVITMGGA